MKTYNSLGINHVMTYFASNTRASIPDATGVDADVPWKSVLQELFMSVVACHKNNVINNT